MIRWYWKILKKKVEEEEEERKKKESSQHAYLRWNKYSILKSHEHGASTKKKQKDPAREGP